MSGPQNDTGRSAGAAFSAEIARDAAHRPKSSQIRPLRQLLPFIAPYKATVFLFTFFLIAASALTLALPAAGRLLMDCGFGVAASSPYCGALGEGAGGRALAPYFLSGVAVALVLGMASALRYYFISRLGERVVADIRSAVYAHVLSLSPHFFETTRTGEVLSRLTTDTTLVQTVVGSSVSVALRTMATTVGAVAMMAIVNWKLALMVLAVGPIILVPILTFGRRVQSLSRAGQDRLAEASARASESLAAVSTVQAFTQERRETSAFADAVERTYEVSMRRVRVRSTMTALFFSLILTAVILVLWYGAVQVQAGAITGGAMLQFMMYAFIAVSGAGFLTETWTEIMRAAGATERLMELLQATSDIAPPERPAALPHQGAGRADFEGVSFAYPTRADIQALNDFSLAVEPGETVALVGPSGAGKTTVFQLLLRFYDPQDGTVRLDGVDVRDLDPETVRGAIAVVQQNAPLFSGSALENIRYGRPDASDAEVRAAAKAAMADGFITALPEGYDTDLGERGATLSGGQRQRIAIARAILRDAPLLLLDEATSALDAESERLVQDAFERLSADRTTIVIAHRLATVLKADRIVVMKDGRIVDQGSHESLMAKDGLYARLAKLQFDTAIAAAAE
ncbi:MAG: ABC transporter transmembrane domain-containing protein [Pseudomonadota bacterium]